MIYLKTYFYSRHELPFLLLNLLEAYNHIDKFIICEYNYTHTGLKRDYIFDIEYFPLSLRDKILYLACDISGHIIKNCTSEKLCHEINEKIMRGIFVNHINLLDDDIVISVDADEIIYGQVYPDILKYVSTHEIVLLNLHQFFYRINYHWLNKDFKAPIITKAKYFKHNIKSDWRYQGVLYPHKVGCHFSWCMPIDNMIIKIYSGAHNQYKHLADKEILANAIENKIYPFNPREKFEIEIINLEISTIIPEQMKLNLNIFKDLIYYKS